MKVLLRNDGTDDLEGLISKSTVGDYIYMYPPRQVYRKLDAIDPLAFISSSLKRESQINIYFQFPFCTQICAFCNLFSYVENDQNVYRNYLSVLKREIDTFSSLLIRKKVESVYLGGGTPSLMPPAIFEELFTFLEKKIECSFNEISEVAIEISPETVTAELLSAYRSIGINRVNLGVQSARDHELKSIGREYGEIVTNKAIELSLKAGFDNVCVDLIYGIDGQSIDDWERSVETVLSYSPETICAYPLTLRPFTGFDNRGYHNIDGASQFRKYDYINNRLISAGYLQETNVRWIKNERGGYRQKTNHWHLQNVIGFGAGARSYLWEIDTRNGYSIRKRKFAFKEYISRVNTIGHGLIDGYLMDDNERKRKAIILGLISLNRNWYSSIFRTDILADFGMELNLLSAMGLVTITSESINLTQRGVRHRDLIVQQFFSKQVTDSLLVFKYDE